MHYKFEEVSQISKEVAGGWLCIILNEKALTNEEDYSKRARTLLKGKKRILINLLLQFHILPATDHRGCR